MPAIPSEEIATFSCLFVNPVQMLETVMPTVASEGVGMWTRAIDSAEIGDTQKSESCRVSF